MLSKRPDPLARIAEKRIVSPAAALSVLLGVLAFAGQAGADVSATGALGSITTQATTAVRSGSVGRADTSPVAPASEAATQAAGSIVVSPTRVVAQGGSSATQSAGHTAAPLKTPAPQPVGSAIRAASSVVAPTRKLAPSTPAPQPPIAMTPARSGGSSAPSGDGPLELRNRRSGVAACAVAAQDERFVTCRPGAARPPSGVRTLARGMPDEAGLAPADDSVSGHASVLARGGPPSVGVRSSPRPIPLPGGVSGSSAAALSLACAISLALAGIWLFGCPRATRRLARASAPSRAAPFVLMPERPG